ncbi:MAG: hypothetical protein FJ044_00285 [Candidatus Cloacimonetes bacterium]|nr:hypothetical protein [Candidatus Cloacimonadota bacterium]
MAGLFLSIVLTVIFIRLLPEDSCLTILTLSQFFTFFFLGAYGEDTKINPLHPVAAIFSAFCVAEGGVLLLTNLSAFLSSEWVWIPDFKFIVVLSIINWAGYLLGLLLSMRRR